MTLSCFLLFSLKEFIEMNCNLIKKTLLLLLLLLLLLILLMVSKWAGSDV